MSSTANLIKIAFASGTAEVNRGMLERFSATHPELPLCVVAEFPPETGEWIPWHVQRSLEQNVDAVRAALGDRKIGAAAMAFDTRAAHKSMRAAARKLAPRGLVVYDEQFGTAVSPVRRALRSIMRQLRPGGRVRLWLRRLIHPSEAEIPIRARMAQARGSLPRAQSVGDDPPLRGHSPLADGVTVVIPSRDGRELLEQMLPLLSGQFETIVVDNGSSDGTKEWLGEEWPSVKVIHHAQALSFACASNLGIEASRSSQTLLLNNDMLVEPGFVEALRAAFKSVPDLFCATAQIFFPAGMRREETGKAIWRQDNPADFPVRCDDPIPAEDLTWVLYGSGGCSLYDTQRLRELRGFSTAFDPAYVEDLDLGYRAWKRGWPTVFCANARVEHRHRATTTRFYTSAELDLFVERNYLRFLVHAIGSPELFRSLWSQGIRRLQLAGDLNALREAPVVGAQPREVTGHLSEAEILALNSGDVAVFAGRREHAERCVVIASPYLPFPLSHGGAVRIYNLMCEAAKVNSLVLIAFCDDLANPPAELLEICHRVVLVRRHGTHYRRNTALPDTVEEFESATFRACLRQAVHQWKPVIVQLEFTWMAQYAGACRPATTILVEHDITFDLQQQMLETTAGDGLIRWELAQQLEKWRAFETGAWREMDAVVTMSQKDSETVTGASHVACLPNGVDCTRFQPDPAHPEPRRLLFIGSFAHLPNLLALEFFLREVWPLLSPGYTLHIIAGSKPDYYLDFHRERVTLDLTDTDIELDGFVIDVRDAYRRAEIVLAPLTASAGTNIKVLEAMAMGRAVVSTPAGVNGLDVRHDHDTLIAASGSEMAEEILSLSANPTRRRAIEINARETALRYGWPAIGELQNVLYDRLYGDRIQPRSDGGDRSSETH